jgi:hypothetical protein
MPEAVETMDKKIIGKLTNFKKLMKTFEITSANSIKIGTLSQPASTPRQMAINKYKLARFVGGAQQL